MNDKIVGPADALSHEQIGLLASKPADLDFILRATLGRLGLSQPRPEDMPQRWGKTEFGQIFLRRWLAEHPADYVSPSTAAKRAGASLQTIRQLAHYGKIATIPNPDQAPGGASYLVNLASLDAYLSDREKLEDA